MPLKGKYKAKVNEFPHLYYFDHHLMHQDDFIPFEINPILNLDTNKTSYSTSSENNYSDIEPQ